MHRGCFVWIPSPPFAGRRTPRPGPVRVCVCSSFLAGSGGPASWARSGAPHLFLWPLCLSASLGPLRAGDAPFLFLCLPLFLFFFVVPFVRLRCPLLSVVSGPECLGPLRFVFLSSPPPSCVFLFFFFFFPLSLCPFIVFGFLWFPATGALGLGAVCCLFWWSPASRIPVRSGCYCVSCLAAG